MNIKQQITNVFSNAESKDQVIGDIKHKVFKELGLEPERTIAAVSVCPDELNRETLGALKGSFGNYFNLGGLSGYPFAGVTGFNAFADHIPDEGNAIIFFGPHIGIDVEGWGLTHRVGQARKTTCCGSVIGAHTAIKNKIGPSVAVNDFQQSQVHKMIENGITNIKGEVQLKDLSNIILKNSYAFILEQAKRIKEQFNANKIVLIGFIIINTPIGMSDYLSMEILHEI